MPKGTYLSAGEKSQIEKLLAGTDMSMLSIAERMHCSAAAIRGVNRDAHIRGYDGLRLKWATAAGECDIRISKNYF